MDLPRPRTARLLLAVAALFLILPPGCSPDQHAAPATAGVSVSADGADDDLRRFPLVGTVVRIDRESGSVAIRHEAIPDFMPAMTMPFDLAGQEILEDLEVGDEVEGTLVVGAEDSELVDLTITRPAIAPPVVLDTSGPTPVLRPRQKVLEIGQEVPDFTVTTQTGERLALSGLRGHVVALTFIYTRCPLPEFCPRMDQNFRRLAELVRMLPARDEDRVRLLSISFDPEHDTPEVLARHAALRGAEPPLWCFAVAADDELSRVAEPLGLTYGPRPGEIAHNLITAVIGADGRLLRLEPGGDWAPEDLYGTIARAARAAPQTAETAPSGR